MRGGELVESEFSTRVLKVVSPWVIRAFWRQYNKIFTPLQKKSICRQTYHRGEFWKVMVDRDFLKIFVFKGSQPRWVNSLGFGILALNRALRKDKLPWISREGLKGRFPKLFPYLGYIPCIFIRFEEQGGGAATFLFSEFSRLLVENKLYVTGFDFAAVNKWLPEAIIRSVEGVRALGEGDHDSQHYRFLIPVGISSDGEKLVSAWRAD